MFRLVLLSVLAAVGSAQYYNKDPKTAAILSEQRYLQGDGKFGAAYTQEDGINFKEETDADGTRRGSYSYIDPSGQKKTISYTAGKHGFVASGDHLPVAPAPPPHAAAPAPAAPQPQYNNAGPATFGRSYESGSDYDDGQYDPRYNDPSFAGNALPAGARQSYNAPAPAAPVYQPQPQHQQYRAPAAPAYNPAPVPAYNPAPAPQQNYNHIPQTPYFTTENPHRFQPPGKLSLSRTQDGFSYTFAKQ